MQLLPSLLECSPELLGQKLELVFNNKAKFLELTNQKVISFHLDFVFQQFAKDRSVMQSNGPETVFAALEKYFNKTKIELSIHLMGDTEDLLDAYRFFENYVFNPAWKYVVLVPEKFYNIWESLLDSKNSAFQTGVWYDLGEWQNQKFEVAEQNLLMTVLAGKSGQKLTPETKQKVIEVVKSNPNHFYLLDGGWGLDDLKLNLDNADIVSYSGFWQDFMVG